MCFLFQSEAYVMFHWSVTFQIAATHFLNGGLSAAPQSHQQYPWLLSCCGALVHVRLLHAVAETFRKRPSHIIAARQSRSLVLNWHDCVLSFAGPGEALHRSRCLETSPAWAAKIVRGGTHCRHALQLAWRAKKPVLAQIATAVTRLTPHESQNLNKKKAKMFEKLRTAHEGEKRDRFGKTKLTWRREFIVKRSSQVYVSATRRNPQLLATPPYG